MYLTFFPTWDFLTTLLIWATLDALTTWET